jgi:hypothetical protein
VSLLSIQSIIISAIPYYFLPEPMVLEEKIYLLYWNLLCFWKEKEDEGAHESDQASKYQKNPITNMAERHEKALCYQSCEDHVDTDNNALAS